MVNREQFEEICNRYGLDSKKLIKNNENVLEKADYNSICYVLDFLRDTLKVTPNNIEKCPSILYLNGGSNTHHGFFIHPLNVL